MPTRLPTLRLRPARPSTKSPVLGDSTDPLTPSAPTSASAVVHKPLSVISRMGTSFFNRKTIDAGTTTKPEPAQRKPLVKRISTTHAPHGGTRRGATESNLLASHPPAGVLTKRTAKASGSTRTLIKPMHAVQPLEAGTIEPPLPVATKEDDTREPTESAPPPLVPHRPPASPDDASTTSTGTSAPRAPRRPILSKKQSAKELEVSGVVASSTTLQRGTSSRSIAHFDRAKVDSLSHASALNDSPSKSIGPPVPTGPSVLDRCSAELTAFEQKEILEFPEVYYYSTMGVKRRRQPGHILSAAEADAMPHDNMTPSSKGEVVYNDGFDDDRGDYVMLMHDHLAYRYEVLHPLGSGSFGQVVCCLDHTTNTKVAVKVIRNHKRYKEQALIEIQMLTLLHDTTNEGDRKTAHHLVHMRAHFVFRNHLCITFELLGMNLYDYLKLRFFQGMPMANLRIIATQLLMGLVHLRSKHMVHCDLKPENVLIRAPLQCFAAGPGCASVTYANVPVETICLIDFGSSCLDTATVYTYIQSRFYRSPEVILGHAYGTAIDMWSVGCILVELYTGHPLFAGENETEQLLCMMEILGLPASSYLAQCKRRRYFFQEVPVPAAVAAEAAGESGEPEKSGESGDNPAKTIPVVTYRPLSITNSRGRKRVPCCRDLGLVIKSDDADFVALVRKCLMWDPNDRLTPDAALLEPWILAKEARKPSEE